MSHFRRASSTHVFHPLLTRSDGDRVWKQLLSDPKITGLNTKRVALPGMADPGIYARPRTSHRLARDSFHGFSPSPTRRAAACSPGLATSGLSSKATQDHRNRVVEPTAPLFSPSRDACCCPKMKRSGRQTEINGSPRLIRGCLL